MLVADGGPLAAGGAVVGYLAVVHDPEPTKTLSRDAATLAVSLAGEAGAARAGLLCVAEQSNNSESRYLHVQRGEVWYGVRISCHEPVYDCCRDYEQINLGDAPSEPSVARAVGEVERLIVGGGSIVANPSDVAVAVEKIAAVLNDGCTCRDDDGLRWKWSSGEGRWNLACRYWGPEEELTPPVGPPGSRVTARIRCQVRHAQNVAARWSVEGEPS